MDNATFEAITGRFIEQCMQIQKTKGDEYSGNEDRLANFKRYSASLGLNPTTVLMIYMGKHWDSIMSFIKNLEKTKDLATLEKTLSEPIDGRLQDLVNYALLLNGLIHEARMKTNG